MGLAMRDRLRSGRLDQLAWRRRELLDRAACLGVEAEAALGYLRLGKVMLPLDVFEELLDELDAEPPLEVPISDA
jgi:hypothetical protein